jgi:hypothetical protein
MEMIPTRPLPLDGSEREVFSLWDQQMCYMTWRTILYREYLQCLFWLSTFLVLLLV